MTEILIRMLELALFVPAIVLHEVAHGRVAYWLGDPTAKLRGRLSLNPVRHVDPFGTILLPLLLWIGGAPVFGYAKPVPINPHYFRDYRRGMMITGLAGPATNLALAFLAALGVRGLLIAAQPLMDGGTGEGALVALTWTFYAFYYFAQINFVLMFFNLIPIPPLDGSRVLPLFLSDRALETYHRVEQYGILIFFGLLLVLPMILPFSPLGAYFDVTVRPLMFLFTGVQL